MVDKINSKTDEVADEKKPATASPSVGAGAGAVAEKKKSNAKAVLHTLDAISQPQNVKKFYVAYLTSDIVLAGLTYAVIMSIRLWFHIPWDSTWNSMWLYYLLFISIIVAKLNKSVGDYLKAKMVHDYGKR